MDFGKLIGQVLQQGMSQNSQARVNHSLGDAGLGGLLGQMLGGGQSGAAGGGLGQVLGSVLGGQSGGAAAGGNLGAILGSMLGAGQATGGQRTAGGGLGDLLGGLLSAGTQRGGAQRGGGSGMAVLASLAMAALKNWQGGGAGNAGAGMMGLSSSADIEEFERLSSAEHEELMLRAMLSAAKADGKVDEDELQHIVGRMAEDGLSAEEKQFLVDELQRPLDLPGLIAAVPNREVGAQVYAASLLAIELDHEAEYAYLRQLAQGLGLDAATIERLHQFTGVRA